jgi:hypothetical protein
MPSGAADAELMRLGRGGACYGLMSMKGFAGIVPLLGPLAWAPHTLRNGVGGPFARA